MSDTVPAVPRAQAIIDAALELLEGEGAEALTMRRLAERVGIKAPSLYKHFPDKAALEAELASVCLQGVAEALEAAEAREPGSLYAIGEAYRRYAAEHPHLYRLATDRPLRRELLRPGVEERAAMPLLRSVGGDEHRARAAWAFAHGMVLLELGGRFPPDADPAEAWRTGIAAFAS